MALKGVQQKIEKGWSITKKTLAAASVWGLIFSVVTIAKLGVAFDYDDTLVNSAGAFKKAYANAQQAYSPGFWTIVNNAYELERPKLFTYPIAWVFRCLGFRVSVVSSRPAVDAEPLKKEWRYLIGRGNFYFAGDDGNKRAILSTGNFVLYFGDSDTDIMEARKARVFPIRVRRSRQSLFKEDYHPGTLGELVIPFSEY